MQKFLIYCFRLLLLVFFGLVVLDVIYTFAFSQSSRRSKIQNIVNGKPQFFDVVVMGSSRANNHFVTKVFTDKGLKAFNYGMSGSRLQETALTLELMLEKGTKIKNVILEVDLNINSDGYSEGTRAALMPYLHTSKVIRNYYDTIPNFKKLYYIPFYRYIFYDSKIGMREAFYSCLDKKTVFLDNEGFYPLLNKGKNLNYNMSTYLPKRNKSYERIKFLCQKNNINLISVTTPICLEANGRAAYFKALRKVYPEILHFEDIVTNDSCFSSCGHMNKVGALLFTTAVAQQIILRK